MPKDYLQNIDVECWREVSKLGKSRTTLCFYHSHVEQGRELLQAIDELSLEGPPARRAATFKPCERKRSIAMLRLSLVADGPTLRVMHVAMEDGAATIEMTAIGLAILRDGLTTWCQGCEDFGVSVGRAKLPRRELGERDKASPEVWFWGPTMG